MFCYEYGYLCFQVIVLTIQVVILTRGQADGFKIFMEATKGYSSSSRFRALLVAQTKLQLEADVEAVQSNILVRRYEITPTTQGRRLALPSVGGMTDLDGAFLIEALWQTRKELSYIGSKGTTPGWSFLLELLYLYLMLDLKDGKWVVPNGWLIVDAY